MNSKLKDRILWYDGDNTVDEDQLCEIILQDKDLDGLFIDEITDNIKRYNLISDKKIDVKYGCRSLDTSWNLPEYYLNIDLEKYCFDNVKYNNDKITNRINDELFLIKKLNLENLFRAIIYILDYFKQNGIVWGVGRGSSCASYILYLFGLHKVDCIKYDVDLKEFFKIDK
jgi:DNA polymerase III alpha subunit